MSDAEPPPNHCSNPAPPRTLRRPRQPHDPSTLRPDCAFGRSPRPHDQSSLSSDRCFDRSSRTNALSALCPDCVIGRSPRSQDPSTFRSDRGPGRNRLQPGRLPPPRGQAGSATIWAIAMVLLASSAAACALVWIGAVAARHSAERAADQAALAAAGGAVVDEAHELVSRATGATLVAAGFL